MGLAWKRDGGVLLPVEALIMPGTGYKTVTGLLGEVMEESVEAALSYVRAHAKELDIRPEIFPKTDLRARQDARSPGARSTRGVRAGACEEESGAALTIQQPAWLSVPFGMRRCGSRVTA
jgi:ATP-dependent Lon protease